MRSDRWYHNYSDLGIAVTSGPGVENPWPRSNFQEDSESISHQKVLVRYRSYWLVALKLLCVFLAWGLIAPRKFIHNSTLSLLWIYILIRRGMSIFEYSQNIYINLVVHLFITKDHNSKRSRVLAGTPLFVLFYFTPLHQNHLILLLAITIINMHCSCFTMSNSSHRSAPSPLPTSLR